MMTTTHSLTLLRIMYYAFNMDQYHQTHAWGCKYSCGCLEGIQLGRCIWQHDHMR